MMKNVWLTALAALMLAAVGCQQEKTPEVAPAQQSATEAQKAAEPAPPVAAPAAEEKAEQPAEPAAPQAETAAAPAAPAEKPATGEAKPAPVEAKPAPAEPKEAATEAKPKAAAPQPPQTVVYDASYGKVAFDHAAHAARLGCGSCHDSDPPVKVAVDKEKAHQMCKGCHQEKGAGPTQCGGCHKKG